MKSLGFTLIELILVVAVILIVAAISSPLYSRLLIKNDASVTTDQLVSSLRKAQTYSQSGRQNSSWGVRYYQDNLVLFAGNSYSSRNASLDENISVNSNIQISGFTEIVFSRIYGQPNSQATITISGVGSSHSIIVNQIGGISRL